MSSGSGTFLALNKTAKTAKAIATVTQSTIDRRARITTAPAIAPRRLL